MTKKAKGNDTNKVKITIEDVKRWGVQAMFSDDSLLNELVLKGGNAITLVHRLSNRSSVDLDFSMKQDFSDIDKVKEKIKKTLDKTFSEKGFKVFDFKMNEKPKEISEDIASFWGGYGVEFKLIATDLYEHHKDNEENMRRHAIVIGRGPKFEMDISRFEYVDNKEEYDIDGLKIYAYSPEMIVCEKLRAICQQMPAYGTIVKRNRPGSARARDFVDIYVLVNSLNIDITQPDVTNILDGMFKVKEVPLSFLWDINKYKEFHQSDFDSAKVTMTGDIHDFDFYFDFTIKLVDSLKSLRDK